MRIRVALYDYFDTNDFKTSIDTEDLDQVTQHVKANIEYFTRTIRQNGFLDIDQI
jgi:hypothetical protein